MKACEKTVATRVRLDLFQPTGLERGRSKWIEALWYVCKCLFFLSPVPWPSVWKCIILRGFGARVGTGVVLKPRINIHLPWKLHIGDYSWIGEEVFILNLELVTIGSQCCISQRAFLCAGNHDYRNPEFGYSSAPIVIGDGAWIGAQVFVAAGARVGIDSVVLASSRVSGELPAFMICDGSPARALKPRWRDSQS